jgi:hypothetical protein
MGCCYFVLNIPCAQLRPKSALAEYVRSQFPRSRSFDFVRNWSRDGGRIPVLFKEELLQQVCSQNAAAVTSLLSSTPRRAGNHPQRLHKWHTGPPVQGRGHAYPSPPAPSFRVSRYERGRLGTGKGNGAGGRSLVKYNQPLGTPMLELEELKLLFSVGR